MIMIPSMTTDRIRAMLATVNNVLSGFNSFTERTRLLLEIELSILRTGRPMIYRISSQNDALFAANQYATFEMK